MTPLESVHSTHTVSVHPVATVRTPFITYPETDR